MRPNIFMIAEELPNTDNISKEDIGSDYKGTNHGPFDSQWRDNFHDSLKRVLMGTGKLDELYNVFSDFGDNWHDGVIYSESHDEVSNHDPNTNWEDRVAKVARDEKGRQMSRISITATLLSRGIPMIFMGQEGAEETPFDINAWSDRIPIEKYETDSYITPLLKWNSDVFMLRKKDSSSFSSGDIKITHIYDDNGVAVFTRDNSKYVVVLNFKGTQFENYDIGVKGNYKEVMNSDSSEYKLGDAGSCSNGSGVTIDISSICIPQYGVVIFRKN